MTQPNPDTSPTVAPHGPPSAGPTEATPSTSVSSTSPAEKLPTTGPDAGLMAAFGLGALLIGAAAITAVAARARRG